MAMTQEHKTAIKNIRKAIKTAGFKASVSGFTACGEQVVRVCTPTYDDMFTSEQIVVFASEALSIGLTHVRNTPFTAEADAVRTGARQFNYYI